MFRPGLKRSSSGNILDHNPPPPPPSDPTPSSMHVKRFTLTSKPNWWLVEVDNEKTSDSASFESDDTAVSDNDTCSTPPASATVYKPSSKHPTQLFQFPTPPAYSAPPNPTSHLSPIATGSTSELFKCVIKKPDVVQLEINGEMQSNITDVCTQFLAELRVYRTVTRHRNIVAFMGCLEGLGMVLEYVDGSPLLDVIRQRGSALSRATKVDFHNQLLSGLSHVHSFGLSHGDLSLLNVHVTKSSQILKILDFGRSVTAPTYVHPSTPRETSFHSGAKRQKSIPLAAARSPQDSLLESGIGEKEQIQPGTRPFTAPEILRGQCRDPIIADAYSFGIILLCLDLNELADVDPEYQIDDGQIDTSGCEIFTSRIRWYTAHWRERRTMRKEDQMR